MATVSLYAKVAGLPLVVESYRLAGLERDVSSAFKRRTTVITLAGDGEEGVGEDVTYASAEHEALQSAGPVLDLAGRFTFDEFSSRFDGWPDYRRWGFESAALDLALKQAGSSLADALGLEMRPVRYVVSTRVTSAAPLRRLRELYPGLRFKLDPTSEWTGELVDELAALEAVDVLDLKGAYEGTVVDQAPDPALYRLVAEAFPAALIEDPNLRDPACDEVLRPHRDRISWDAVIHSVADIEALPFAPRTLNFKPSRFGSVRALLEAHEFCSERGIAAYGGGQFELGPGRGHIQYLASLFHPDAPNDVAPGGFNDSEPGPGLPTSPLAVSRLQAAGFGRTV